MGESLNPDRSKDATLNKLEVNEIALRGGMPREETWPLQMALAAHLYLLEHQGEALIRDIDFLHPWDEGHVNRRSVMNDWVGDLTKESKAAKFTDFIENLPKGVSAGTVHISNRREREELLQRMGIELPKTDETIH